MTEKRETTTRNIAWFLDLRRRENGLDLNPPYQRRSVWNRQFRQYFVETVLLNLPAPAIFLFEEISEEGVLSYSVVDGERRTQRYLTSLIPYFQFLTRRKSNAYAGSISPNSLPRRSRRHTPIFCRWRSCRQVMRRHLMRYLTVSTGTSVVSTRAAARKFGGAFATTIEELSAELFDALPAALPPYR